MNLDLMTAAPGQTLAAVERDLEAAVALGVQHVSVYCLTWEKGTAFEAARRRRQLAPADDDLERARFETAIDRLEAAGFEHYEISNVARGGPNVRTGASRVLAVFALPSRSNAGTQERSSARHPESVAMHVPCRPLVRLACLAVAAFTVAGAAPPSVAQPARQPNILVIWGDDIGQFNVGAYNLGMMGYRTPNIDRIAREGCLFTDWYGQQSCTAGRAAFITGQSPIRTGLTKVGLPGAPEGMRPEDPTIATLLRARGYVTGQFGKNHLGDRDEMLPTNHGFDEFFGNLYHLNAEEEPEHPDYPKGAEFRKKFGPRGVIHSFADGKITDTGPLTRKRMETIDEEVNAKTVAFMEKAKRDGKPFFVWWNSTKMHIFTHLEEGVAGKTGLGIYADGMVEHDRQVGELLAKLDELGLAENTIVMYSTDNGAEAFTWPDGGTTMFRGEKNTQWEGGYRVPCAIRWPGVVKPGTVINEIGAHEDMLTTLCAAAGDTTAKDDLKAGRRIGKRTYKVHLDGYDLGPALRGQAEWPRKEFIYWTDDGSVAALRYGNWKATFLKQPAHGMHVWQQPFEELRAPTLVNLRMDPFELAQDIGMDYQRWYLEHMFMIAPAGAYVGQWLQSFKEFPPRQKPGSFNLNRVMEAVTAGSGTSR